MESEIYAGDIAVVKEIDTDKLHEGDVIAFNIDGTVVTHRIKKIINEDGSVKYITKGDNNNVEDSRYVLPQQVEGIYKFKIRRLGNLAMFLQEPVGMIISLSIPVILLVLVQIHTSKTDKKYYEQVENEKIKMEEELKKLRKENTELKK